MNSYFNFTEKVFDITEKYPETIAVLADNGFHNLQNPMTRKTVGKTISLETALKSKGADMAVVENQMVAAIEEKVNQAAQSPEQAAEKAGIEVSGVLPCPIRLQLVERLESWIARQDTPVVTKLQAASVGLDWLRYNILNKPDALSDIYLSAGFSLFFDRSVMGKYLDENVFSNIVSQESYHKDFCSPDTDLRDPHNQYTIIGVVPAVFMVNTDLLQGRPFPRSWQDLMKPEFENTIAFPTKDLDLFNAVLLAIYQRYGRKGVEKLGKAMVANMHPAQMVKAGKRSTQTNPPVVSVCPYFFTCMVGETNPMKPVWPTDGAVISPILLMTKTKSREKIQPLAEFFLSKEMGDILSADGKFPSTHPEVDNGLTPEQKFMWPGWDFIHENDVAKLLTDTENMFYGR